jgi:hypothetical protein
MDNRLSEKDTALSAASFPQDNRGLLEAFRRYDRSTGLVSVLDRFDLSGVRPRHVYHTVLGRLPETAQVALPGPGYSARNYAHAALVSDEFQRNILSLFLRAFPERRRLIFIHIPKCAGTHLQLRLRTRYPTLSAEFQERALAPTEGLFTLLRDLVSTSDPNLFVFGHLPLSWFSQRSLLRPTDALFTVVRDPLDLTLSAVNYIAGKLIAFPTFASSDTKVWADSLGISAGGSWLDDKPALCRAILMNPALTPKNALCHYLGSGTARSAIDAIIRTNIEITDVTRYNKWFAEKWELPLGPRENVSDPVISRDDLTADDLNYIEALTQEDRGLYTKIIGSLDQSPRSSVFGESLSSR